MTLPHSDRSQPSPWTEWPEHLPEPAAVRSIEKVDDETREVYRITMPNGATHAIWRVINSWDGEYEYGRGSGDWTPYGLVFDKDEGLLEGPGSEDICAAVEEWADQDHGKPCPTCRCSGRVPTSMRTLLDNTPLWFLPVQEPWMSCPTCLVMSRIPHPPA